MSRKSLARRYSEALFLSAKEKNILNQVEEELKLVMDTISENHELRDFIDRKMVPVQTKEIVLEKVFSGKISSAVLNFLKVVIKKRREEFLEDIVKEYTAFADKERKIAEAEVKSAIELTSQQLKMIEERLAAVTSKEIRLYTKVDPDLLGGIVIRIGDKVYDGSAKQQLRSLRKNLEAVQFDRDWGEKA